MSNRGRLSVGLVGFGLVALTLGGCVSQQQYDQLQDSYYMQRDQNTNLSRENAQLRESLDLTRGAGQETEGTLSSLQRQNADLRARLEESNKLLSEVDAQMRTLKMIDPKFDQALRDLANKYRNVIIYDADRGMLRFASDLTFNSGSDQVRENARQTLTALADVIKTQTAGQYELQIVGHTDAEPISSGTAQRHPTNTHLSVHRAIGVKQVLVSMGVPTDRVLVAGWGETRPAVANGPGGNTPQNRRVEIFFRPDTSGAGSPRAASINADPAGDAAGSYSEPTK